MTYGRGDGLAEKFRRKAVAAASLGARSLVGNGHKRDGFIDVEAAKTRHL